MTDRVPLNPEKPESRSTPISYKVIDHTEFSPNKAILQDVFESDIVMTKDQMLDAIDAFQQRLNGSSLRQKRKSISGDRYRWENATVLFVFNNTNPQWQVTVWEGMRKWEAETCIKFKQLHPLTREKDYVLILKGGGCYSSVGRIGGRQTASIGYGCESAGIVAHEMGHALGFWHEQNRVDRDQYINIDEDHILNGTKGNFQRHFDIDSLDVPYDYGSVMHYGSQAFANDWNYVTVETKDHRYQHTIGQRARLSFTDVKQANLLYCRDVCKNEITCHNGGYQDPKNCLMCRCPPGLHGDCNLLEPSKPGCGGELFALGSWQVLSSQTTGRCIWRINASPEQRIHFEVVHASFSCDSSCSENYLEIKHTSNLQQTGFRQCCRAAPGMLISSSNQVIIISNTVNGPANFTLRYIIDAPIIPPPPLAPWEGDGLTSFLGGEIGIDNTLEKYIFTDLPKAFKQQRPSPNKPFDALSTLVTSFLRSTRAGH
uniref:Zinc metalloproteinase n=1 Tax=Panagrellus redivivus TaxID=6233 RepID=A0A7E4ZWY1_PANRE